MTIGPEHIWNLAVLVFFGILAFLVKRTLSSYDKSLQELKAVIADFQKEISQIRLDAALLKQSSLDAARYSDKIYELDKAQAVLERQVKAAFEILTGKRKSWEEINNELNKKNS